MVSPAAEVRLWAKSLAPCAYSDGEMIYAAGAKEEEIPPEAGDLRAGEALLPTDAGWVTVSWPPVMSPGRLWPVDIAQWAAALGQCAYFDGVRPVYVGVAEENVDAPVEGGLALVPGKGGWTAVGYPGMAATFGYRGAKSRNQDTLDVLKSALHKYARRGDEEGLDWTMGELLGFFTTPGRHAGAKGNRTSILNRLRIVLMEDATLALQEVPRVNRALKILAGGPPLDKAAAASILAQILARAPKTRTPSWARTWARCVTELGDGQGIRRALYEKLWRAWEYGEGAKGHWSKPGREAVLKMAGEAFMRARVRAGAAVLADEAKGEIVGALEEWLEALKDSEDAFIVPFCLAAAVNAGGVEVKVEVEDDPGAFEKYAAQGPREHPVWVHDAHVAKKKAGAGNFAEVGARLENESEMSDKELEGLYLKQAAGELGLGPYKAKRKADVAARKAGRVVTPGGAAGAPDSESDGGAGPAPFGAKRKAGARKGGAPPPGSESDGGGGFGAEDEDGGRGAEDEDEDGGEPAGLRAWKAAAGRARPPAWARAALPAAAAAGPAGLAAGPRAAPSGDVVLESSLLDDFVALAQLPTRAVSPDVRFGYKGGAGFYVKGPYPLHSPAPGVALAINEWKEAVGLPAPAMRLTEALVDVREPANPKAGARARMIGQVGLFLITGDLRPEEAPKEVVVHGGTASWGPTNVLAASLKGKRPWEPGARDPPEALAPLGRAYLVRAALGIDDPAVRNFVPVGGDYASIDEDRANPGPLLKYQPTAVMAAALRAADRDVGALAEFLVQLVDPEVPEPTPGAYARLGKLAAWVQEHGPPMNEAEALRAGIRE
jgi:hypothetical protein